MEWIASCNSSIDPNQKQYESVYFNTMFMPQAVCFWDTPLSLAQISKRYAHLSPEIKTALKQLLAAANFTKNMGYMEIFEPLQTFCQEQLLVIGGPLQQLYGSVACFECSAGRAGDGCKACKVGTYRGNDDTDSTQCIDCKVGFHINSTGQPYCTATREIRGAPPDGKIVVKMGVNDQNSELDIRQRQSLMNAISVSLSTRKLYWFWNALPALNNTILSCQEMPKPLLEGTGRDIISGIHDEDLRNYLNEINPYTHCRPFLGYSSDKYKGPNNQTYLLSDIKIPVAGRALGGIHVIVGGVVFFSLAIAFCTTIIG